MGCWEQNAGEFYVRPKLDFNWKQDVFADTLRNHNQGTQSILGMGLVRRRARAQVLPVDFQRYRTLDEKPIATITDVTKAITTAAGNSVKTMTTKWNLNLSPNDALIIEEKALADKRRRLDHGVERKEISIKLCTIRKQIKAQQIILRGQKAVAEQRSPISTNKRVSIHALCDFKGEGQLIDDPGDILENAGSFFGQLFGENYVSSLPDWVWNRFALDKLDQVPRFDGRTLRTLIMSMQGGKTCAEDGLVAEMLRHLDVDTGDFLLYGPGGAI